MKKLIVAALIVGGFVATSSVASAQGRYPSGLCTIFPEWKYCPRAPQPESSFTHGLVTPKLPNR
jgi:hypothetical protein